MSRFTNIGTGMLALLGTKVHLHTKTHNTLTLCRVQHTCRRVRRRCQQVWMRCHLGPVLFLANMVSELCWIFLGHRVLEVCCVFHNHNWPRALIACTCKLDTHLVFVSQPTCVVILVMVYIEYILQACFIRALPCLVVCCFLPKRIRLCEIQMFLVNMILQCKPYTHCK